MNVRTMVGSLVAAPALLVALANPAGAAATPGALVFSGRIEITPTASGVGQTDFCFLTAKAVCVNGAASTGVVAGAGATPVPEAVDGLQGTATYSESCVGVDQVGTVAATGTATITANVHRALADSWSAPVTAQWTRAGLVAVIRGGGTGAAVFAPMGVPLCGETFEVAVAGSVELSY